MIFRFSTLRPARRLALLTLLAPFIGCPGVGVAPAPVLSDNLPMGVERDASRFRQQLTRFYAKPTHTRTRRAICADGTLRCVVEIEIHVDRVELPDPAAPPPRGLPIARLANLDPRDTEEQYHLVPSSRADYFVWLDPMPGTGGTRWTLLYVPSRGGNVQTAYAKPLTRCHVAKYEVPPVADVDFTEFKSHPAGVLCGAPTSSVVPPSASLASVFSIRPLTALITKIGSLISGGATIPNGIWFECNGCCT